MAETPSIPRNADPLYIVFMAEIVPTTVENLMHVLVQAMKKNVKSVYLVFSTPGGDVQAGITLYEFLTGLPIDLTIHNIGSVNSMGNVIFLAGETRYATKHATFLFHGVGFDANGPVRIDRQFAQDRLDSLTADETRMSSIIADRTDLDTNEITEMFIAQRTVDSSWAKDHGIIEDVRDFRLSPGSAVVSFVFNR